MPGHKPCYCNQEGTQKRARENNGQLELETQTATKVCYHACSLHPPSTPVDLLPPTLCNDGTIFQPGHYDPDCSAHTNQQSPHACVIPGDGPATSCSVSDDTNLRQYVCYNSNECRHICTDNPGATWYDGSYWQYYPYTAYVGTHVGYQANEMAFNPFWTGDMLCSLHDHPEFDGVREHREFMPYFGNVKVEREESWEGFWHRTDTFVQPKSNHFTGCRTFWCFADTHAWTIEEIMANNTVSEDIEWSCFRGVCTATCPDSKYPYVTYSGHTWPKSKYSCDDRGILVGFRDKMPGLRLDCYAAPSWWNYFTEPLSQVDTQFPISGPPESCSSCPSITDQPDYNQVNTKFDSTSNAEGTTFTFVCKDNTQIMTDPSNDQTFASLSVSCAVDSWDENEWNKLLIAECRDLSCDGSFTETNGYGSLPAGASVTCSNDACTVDCGDKFVHPDYSDQATGWKQLIIDCTNVDQIDEIKCYDSPCGPFGLTDDEDQFGYDCNLDTDQCYLICQNGKVANTKVFICDDSQAPPVWENPFNHDATTKPVQCIDDVDTPCGDVADIANLGINGDVDVSCETWVSIYDPTKIVCSFTCQPDQTTFNQHGELSCSNQTWSTIGQQDQTVECCNSACCDPTDADGYADLVGKFTVTQFDADTIEIECQDSNKTAINGADTIETTLICDENGVEVNDPHKGWLTEAWNATKESTCAYVCPELSTMLEYDDIIGNFNQKTRTQVENGNLVVEFECKDPDQTATKGDSDEALASTLVVCSGDPLTWDKSQLELLANAECRDLSCTTDFTEEEGYLNGWMPDEFSITCADDSCSVSCIGQFAFPSVVNC